MGNQEPDTSDGDREAVETQVQVPKETVLKHDNTKHTDAVLAQTELNHQACLELPPHCRTHSLIPSSRGSKTVVEFQRNDPGDPHNWPMKKKIFIITVGIVAVLNSTISSSLASGVIAQIAADFHVKNQEQFVLPTSIFLVGYVVGPLGWGPVSEAFGRYPILISSFSGYLLWSMATALAPTWATLNVFRLLAGVCASSPISVVGGLFSDVFDDLVTRGRALSIFMASTCLGPVAGPIISGFLAPVSWRWSFWVGLIIAGVSWLFLFITPETYGPILLKKRAQSIRKKTGEEVYAPIELETTNWRELLAAVLARPFRMLFFEPLISFSCLFQAFVYGLFFSFFFAYPIIYEGAEVVRSLL